MALLTDGDSAPTLHPVPPAVVAALRNDGGPFGNGVQIEKDRLNRAVRAAGFGQ